MAFQYSLFADVEQTHSPGRKQLAPRTQAHKDAISRAKKGVPATQAAKDAMSRTRTGKKLSPQHRAAISKGQLGNKRHPLTPEHKEMLRKANKGKIISQSQRNAVSMALKGKPSPLRGRQQSREHVLNMRKAVPRGPRHRLWEGGKRHENAMIRASAEYKDWRTAVFSRDGYSCVLCHQRGGRLNADHIKPFALYPESRLDISNGRTLCVPCHRKTDTYGAKVRYYKKQEERNDG